MLLPSGDIFAGTTEEGQYIKVGAENTKDTVLINMLGCVLNIYLPPVSSLCLQGLGSQCWPRNQHSD